MVCHIVGIEPGLRRKPQWRCLGMIATIHFDFGAPTEDSAICIANPLLVVLKSRVATINLRFSIR